VVHGQHAPEQIFAGHFDGVGRLFVEAQRLVGDGGGAAQLAVCRLEVLARLVEALAGSREVDEVGYGLERVVDLVGDGCGQRTDGGELFALNEGGRGAPAGGDVAEEDGDAVDGWPGEHVIPVSSGSG